MGLLNPGALVFASLYGVLVLLYLWDRIRRRLDVPSLLLWQSVREDIVQSRKFRPDLLFVLQALLLAGLIAGLARPYLADGRPAAAARRHIFILDTSASMQAREGRTTRFEEARAALRRRLGTLPTGDEAMLITAAAHPQVVAVFTRDLASLDHLLDGLKPTDTGTNLELALAVAAGARQRTDATADVQVFSDIPPSQLPQHWQSGGQGVSFFQFGETDANLAITGLQILQGRFQDPRAARAYIVVQNFSHREGHGGLTVRLDGAPLLQSGFTISARDTRAFLVPSFPEAGRVQAQLDVDDALRVDNTALGWVRPTATTRVLLVSEATPLVGELIRVAHATAGLQIQTVSPDAYTKAAAAAADVVIFHRFVPRTPPAAAALYIDPPRDNPLFAVSGEAHGVEVLDWNDRHPAIGSLQPLATLPIQRARTILPADGFEPLLLSRTAEREFPLAFAGIQQGRRVACIAFDLEAERLLSSDSVNFLLFFLNLVDWLAPAPAGAITVATGTVVPLGGLPHVPTKAIDPHGQTLDLGDGGHASLETLTAGEYRISAAGVTRTVYANFFDPTESDIGRAGKEPAAPLPVHVADAARMAAAAPGAEFGWWLVAFAAGVLLVEWLVAMRSVGRA
jgi:von Willebrand factor type A domain/Aerotolerance regulator N-terminal